MKNLSRLIICVISLSFGMSHAQEEDLNAPKSDAPIEVTEQKGTVLGSLQKTINYNHITDDTPMIYVFDATADMSDLQAL